MGDSYEARWLARGPGGDHPAGGAGAGRNAPPAPAVILAQAAPPEVCNEIYQPVCATDPAGKRVTYPNACYARRARATNITPGECPK